MRSNLARAFVWSLFLWPFLQSPAAAYEDQATLGLGAGYAHRIAGESPHHGGNFEVNGSVGLDDIWSLRGRLSYAIHPASEAIHTLGVGAEIVYLVDIIEVVPFFGFGADGIGVLSNGETELDLGFHGVLGLEYLASREAYVGFELRPLVFVTLFDVHSAYLFANITTGMIFDL